jgi:hypothetical protein
MDFLTIIPNTVLINVSTMQMLFHHAYQQAKSMTQGRKTVQVQALSFIKKLATRGLCMPQFLQ